MIHTYHKKEIKSNALGIFPIYKPKGPTSHDIIDQLRKLTGITKIGHAGTLDPLAEGVLVVAIGSTFTQQLTTLVEKNKEYLAQIHFGITSTTDDEEGEKKENLITTIPTLQEINKVVTSFCGRIKQTPPQYSAVKIRGEKAYTLARRGKLTPLAARERVIYNIQTLSYEWPFLQIQVTTGPGVYIRALARDIGTQLQTGAYLSQLQRTRVGGFTLKDTLTIEQFKRKICQA